MNIIPLYPNLMRAYQIAYLGGFSISLKLDDEYDYIQGKNDLRYIKEFYSNIGFNSNGLTIDIQKPRDSFSNVKGKTLDEVNKEVDYVRSNIRPTEYLGSAWKALLDTAIKRLSLTLKEVDRIKLYASVIAQLDNSSKIRIEHLAEAIQYGKIRNYTDWIALSDEVPTVELYGEKVFLYRKTTESQISNAVSVFDTIQVKYYEPSETYWMPIPELPKF